MDNNTGCRDDNNDTFNFRNVCVQKFSKFFTLRGNIFFAKPSKGTKYGIIIIPRTFHFANWRPIHAIRENPWMRNLLKFK